MTIARDFQKLRSQRRPWRFVTSRLLWRSGLSTLLTIDCGDYRLRFYPTACSATLWCDSGERLADEEILRRMLRRNDIVIDVGANVGSLTLAASRLVGLGGKVYAIEAHPRTYKYLMGNLRFNQVCNVVAINVACGNASGTVPFSNQRSDDQNCVVKSGLGVSLRRLDDLVTLTAEERIALLKIDVEGYEKFVLEGAVRLLSRTNAVYFESWERHFEKFDYRLHDVVQFLRTFGFETQRIDGSSVSDRYRSECCENLLAIRHQQF